ncbi:MAG: hypothetical protein HY825_18830 [Acidobacteria bacterium]|nr:hypothetical protein [Acidobacteriota bacterium]
MASFWRRIEPDLLRRFPSTTIDELCNLRDLLWFAASSTHSALGVVRPLTALLRDTSSRFLEHGTSVSRPRLPGEAVERAPSPGGLARWYWRWVSLALPPDLLLAALRPLPSCRHVQIVTPHLAQSLSDEGFAQLHLHLGAGVGFADHFVRLQLALADPQIRPDAMDSAAAAFDGGKCLAAWLMRAALARSVLARFVAGRAPHCPDFESSLWTWERTSLGSASAGLLESLLSELSRGALRRPPREHFHEARELFLRITGTRCSLAEWRGGDLQSLDPIAQWFPPSSANGPTPEMRFVATALDYLEGPGAGDAYFAALFWQVIRLRCLYYRHVTQRPLVRGLQWFFRFYDRIDPTSGFTKTAAISVAAVAEGAGRGLRSLEYRTSPKSTINEQLALLDQPRVPTTTQRPGDRRQPPAVELGLVLHFVRGRGGGAREGKPNNRWQGSHADPRANPTGFRYARYYSEQRRACDTLRWVLVHFPLSAAVIRGVDVCTDEQGVPTWVLAPLYRAVVESGEVASALAYQLAGTQLPCLRVTAHAGEDFDHLLGGLRRIDEAVEHFGLNEGARLGHALALGTAPAAWAERVSCVAMPREERLLDLLWEWRWYATQRGEPPARDRSTFLELKIAQLTVDIFGSSKPLPETDADLGRLFDKAWLSSVGFPAGRTNREGPVEAPLAWRYLTDPEVFCRGRELVWLEAAQDIEALEAIQSVLQRRIASRGITVEVNPTSNLLIGDLASLEDHPVFALAPLRPVDSADSVQVCLCSDDPLTFSTTLPDEYQLILDALVMRGASQGEAQQWLDRRRREGLQARFTLRPLEEWLLPHLTSLGLTPREAGNPTSGMIRRLWVSNPDLPSR